MKKLALISALVLGTTAVSAADIGVRTIRHEGKHNVAGITYNTKVMGVNTELAYDRYSKDGFSVDRVSALGVMDLAKLGPVTITAKGGAARLDPSTGSSGYAAMFGVGASYPLTKTATVVVDIMNMRGQTRVSGFDGTSVSAGLKFAF